MPPTTPSRETALVRQDIQTLQSFIDHPHSHTDILTLYISRLEDSLQILRTAHLKTKSESQTRRENDEKTISTLQQKNDTAMFTIIATCANQQDTVESLATDIYTLGRSGTKAYADPDEWANRFALILDLTGAAEELDGSIREMKANEEEARELEGRRECDRRVAEEWGMYEEELGREVEGLVKEAEEVLVKAREMRG